MFCYIAQNKERIAQLTAEAALAARQGEGGEQ